MNIPETANQTNEEVLLELIAEAELSLIRIVRTYGENSEQTREAVIHLKAAKEYLTPEHN
jgi:hypothetical protein